MPYSCVKRNYAICICSGRSGRCRSRIRDGDIKDKQNSSYTKRDKSNITYIIYKLCAMRTWWYKGRCRIRDTGMGDMQSSSYITRDNYVDSCIQKGNA